MKFTYHQTVDDLTWLYVEGTTEELERAAAWTDKNKTKWVYAYPIIHEGKLPDGSAATPTMVKFIMVQRSLGKTGIMGGVTITTTRKFCFKSPSDALRFKLAH